MPQVKSDYILQSKLTTYTLENFDETHRLRVIEGLKKEASLDDTTNLSDFFDKLIFVEDRSEEKFYVKGIMHFQSSKMCSDDFYKAIFKEIRDRQTALKNSEIENEVISKPIDVLAFERSLTTQDLQVFVLNRFVGSDVFSNMRSCPSSYVTYTRRINEDDMENHIFQQNASLSRAFFDKQNQQNFWRLFESIFKEFHKDKNRKVSDVMNAIKPVVMDRVQHMDINSTRFLVAMIRDGLKNDN